MATPTQTQPPFASLITAHLSPTLSLFSSPDLDSVLSSHSLPSLQALLQPFSHSVDKIQLRSANYQPVSVPTFPFHLHQRILPPSFGHSEQPVGRQRSGSLLQTPGGSAAPATPTTPFAYPSQTERDDLFLDSLGSSLSARVEAWLASPSTPVELDVRGVALKPRLGDEEAPAEKEENTREGWEGRSTEELMPWFKGLKEEVFRRREMVDWETFNWPVGCTLSSYLLSAFFSKEKGVVEKTQLTAPPSHRPPRPLHLLPRPSQHPLPPLGVVLPLFALRSVELPPSKWSGGRWKTRVGEWGCAEVCCAGA